MVGRIYLNVAKKLLESNYSEMYELQRDRLLSRADLSELDAYVEAKRPLENACFAIRNELEVCETYLPQDFATIIIHSDVPAEELAAVIEVIKDKGFTETGKAKIALAALFAIHDGWVMDYTGNARFFDQSGADKRYLVLQSELIGFDALMEKYLFIENILEILGLSPKNRHSLEQVYNERRAGFKQYFEIKNTYDLASFIRRANYFALSDSVATAMKDPITAETIARQVALHSGAPETWH
ncbi:hypothetical protein IJJ37_02930 [Candidatus Saccharibacteria bacterium]|nr:hypothetical protein [Candidatus Saccharibacteria bacterium]